jgi:hypothetical protein
VLGGRTDGFTFVTQIVQAGIIQFTVSSAEVGENVGSATIAVQRSGDATASATVQFATSDGTATRRRRRDPHRGDPAHHGQ